MTNPINTAAQDLDTASLDVVVGGAIMHDIRKQEQGDKLTARETDNTSDFFTNRPG